MTCVRTGGLLFSALSFFVFFSSEASLPRLSPTHPSRSGHWHYEWDKGGVVQTCWGTFNTHYQEQGKSQSQDTHNPIHRSKIHPHGWTLYMHTDLHTHIHTSHTHARTHARTHTHTHTQTHVVS